MFGGTQDGCSSSNLADYIFSSQNEGDIGQNHHFKSNCSLDLNFNDKEKILTNKIFENDELSEDL